MPDQKIDNLLNLAMDATPQERRKSGNLNIGYDPATRLWDVIIKYSGPESGLAGNGIQVVPLLGGYAVVTLPESEIDEYSHRVQVEFMEKPKRLYFELFQAKGASCIRTVQTGRNGLTGKGILTGVVDSGVDYFHPDFRNADGSSRILRLWDQSIQGNPPQGYVTGTEYTKEQIDEALALGENQGRRLVPSVDYSGHGTSVLGITAGNGRASDGVNQGVAYESDLIVVKMGIPRENSFPRTTELIQGIDYLVRQSLSLGRPMVINISFGNNYGSHTGTSLLETYLSQVANQWKMAIAIGTGNEGQEALHQQGRLSAFRQELGIELAVDVYETSVNLQFWKRYQDVVDLVLLAPDQSQVFRFLDSEQGVGEGQIASYVWNNTEIHVFFDAPSPYQIYQEIYFAFLPRTDYVDAGVWTIRLLPRRIKDGSYALWLQTGGSLNENTGFLQASEETTLTVPSTADKVISVGAYDSRRNQYASFSGRGFAWVTGEVKPDLVAPGVDITSCAPGGGYVTRSGTSMATPFVTGSAALIMQWGILEGNDSYAYGEKLKAYLLRGALPLLGEPMPSERTGWGKLCLRDSLE